MKFKRLIARCVSIVAAFAGTAGLLAGCGGGGSDSLPDNAGYDVKQAFSNLQTKDLSYSLSGVGSDGASYETTSSQAATTDAVFPLTGVKSARSIVRTTLKKNGTVITNSRSEAFFDRTTGNDLGTDLGNGHCSLVTHQDSLPSLAAIGTSGPYETDDEYDACTGTASVVKSTTYKWSLESASNRVFLCTAFTETATTTTGKTCIEVDHDGTLGAKASVSVSIPSSSNFTLTMTN